MSVQYQAIGWNRQKKIYDAIVAAVALAYLGIFVGAGLALYPDATIETLLIRGFGTLAIVLLSVVLSIGPLCRLSPRFLPLLYNRRHLGVAMFLVALVHGAFSIVQFHALGNVPPLVSLFISNTRYVSLEAFPFESLGAASLVILFLMAATSHDFWLHNLSPRVWKRLHMMVYVAYALVVAHVALGALQSDRDPALTDIVAGSVVVVSALHLAAGFKENRADRAPATPGPRGFIEVCEVHAIPEQRARIVSAGGERIAVFRYDGKISAVSNVCRHQNGPLGEGRILDGCVTCPWHGYQYAPDTGASPPPFTDKVPTYDTRVIGGKVFVNPCPHAPGTRVEPALVDSDAAGVPA